MADKSKKLYWIGKGAVMIGGKPWPNDKDLPLDKLSDEFLERNIKLGNIGEKTHAAQIISTDAQAEITRLNKRVANLVEQVTGLQKDSKKSGSADVKRLEKENEELKAEVERLTKENAELTEVINAEGGK